MNASPESRQGDAGDLHVTVHGRVQGVGFREAMVAAALALGVSGWVRNRFEGSVEAVVRGAPHAREALLQWSQRGPAAARVERVEVRAASAEESGIVRAGFRRIETR